MMNHFSSQPILKYGIGVAHTLDSAWFRENKQSVSVTSDYGQACPVEDLTAEEKRLFSIVDPSWEELPVIMAMLWQVGDKVELLEVDQDSEISVLGSGAVTIFVRVREGVSVTIREQVLSQVVKARIIISLAPRASIRYITLPKMEGSTTAVLRQAFVGAQSKVEFLGADMKGDDLVSHYISYLRETGAESHQRVAFAARSEQIRDIYTKVRHEAAKTVSTITARGVQYDRSVSFYRGLIAMTPAVSGASGREQARMLLLSPHTKAHAVPDLRVAHNDVSCSHAVSISHIDDSKIFYLESRGISPEGAREMIIRSHMQEVITQFPEDLQKYVTASLI